eukprot:4597142-Ditylum_brightwellii.AAC.1
MGMYAREAFTDLICDLPGCGTMWFAYNGIANILALHEAKNKWRVTFVSTKGNAFLIHKQDHTIIFVESKNSLYYHDIGDRSIIIPDKIHKEQEHIMLVSTVAENKALFSNRQCKQAVTARKLYAMVGQPSKSDFKKMVQFNLMPNCPITLQDIKNTKAIFGKDVWALKGKTVRTKPIPVVTDYINAPPDLFKHHHEVTLCVDIVFVNKLLFLTSILRDLHFMMVQHLANRKLDNILKYIKNIVNAYSSRGFKIKVALMDREFDPLKAWP